MKHLPNFITSLNLVSGFISIIFILNGNTTIASWLIVAAMIFDFLDGFTARALKAYSAVGKELDSLADLVSFGVAPGLIIYHLLNAANSTSVITASDTEWYSIFLIPVISSIMPACAALRLAIFNLDTTQTTTFRGLPTPANALAVITLVLGSHYSDSALITSFLGSPLLLILLSLTLSVLMITRIPLLSLKFSDLKIRGNEGRLILIVLCAGMVALFGIGTIPLIIPVYILVSLVSLIF